MAGWTASKAILVALAVAVIALVLLPRPGAEATHHIFQWHEPGLHDHLAQGDLPEGVRTMRLLTTPDAALEDSALTETFGGHRLERLLWTPAAPAGARLELGWSAPTRLVAEVETGGEGRMPRLMEAFLAEILASPEEAGDLARAWAAQGQAWNKKNAQCVPSGSGHGGGESAAAGRNHTGDLDNHGDEAHPCPAIVRIGTRWTLDAQAEEFDPRPWYAARGGYASATPTVEFQGYGVMGRLLRWGDRGMGISVETLVVDGDEPSSWHMLVDRQDRVHLLWAQNDPIPSDDVGVALREHLADLGFPKARLSELRRW